MAPSVVNIPDASLKAAILAEYKTEFGQTLTEITRTQLAQLTTLRATGISDYEGMQYATGLTEFDTGSRLGTTPDLTPIAKLTNLQRFSGNWLSNLDALSGLTNLTAVWVSGSFSDLTPLTHLPKLTTLVLTGDFSDLTPISSLTGLKTIEIASDSLTDLTGVGSLTNVTFAEIQGPFTDLRPISTMTGLTNLQLVAPNVTDFSPLAPIDQQAQIYEDFTNGKITLPDAVVNIPSTLPVIIGPDGNPLTPSTMTEGISGGSVIGNTVTWTLPGTGLIAWNGFCNAHSCFYAYGQQHVTLGAN